MLRIEISEGVAADNWLATDDLGWEPDFKSE